MKNILEKMILKQNPVTVSQYRITLKDVLQKLCLLGLRRAGFFDVAAFYGGTALRMMFGLDRFSEDLDFSLLTSGMDFHLERYADFVQRELKSWNLSAEISIIEKSNSHIESAFLKTNTLLTFWEIKINSPLLDRLHKGEITKVKFEIDTNPPCKFASEMSYILEPIPFSIRVMNASDLFAGKMHAVLARNWKTRVKGRDWYDMIWFISNNIKLNIDHLEKRLQQSGHLESTVTLEREMLTSLLQQRLSKIDTSQAKQDVLPFIANPQKLDFWSEDFFKNLIERVIVE
ncbi:MAG: nucleotidyl transferase AbiEii/AbiGii toxin family protein [Candidatus Cloacimonetes bacterium]|nr:nucleotidyl transferase AbiEii/AbiGii toxin family protein [Candidatus Cloacimonadota bacterium]